MVNLDVVAVNKRPSQFKERLVEIIENFEGCHALIVVLSLH